MNFFSDGDLTPELTSPSVSRPPSPKSDTEVEVYKNKRGEVDLNQWNWDWGQLPERQNSLIETPKLEEIPKENQTEKDDQLPIEITKDFAIASIDREVIKVPEVTQVPEITNVLEAPKETISNPAIINPIIANPATKLINKSDIKPNPEGIYLEETEKLDSEVAALYLDQKTNSTKMVPKQAPTQINVAKDDDQESGNGQSLPQSPLRDSFTILGDIHISLCGFNFNNTANNSAMASPKPASDAQISPGSSVAPLATSLPTTSSLTVSTSINNFAEISSTSPRSPAVVQSPDVTPANFDEMFQLCSVPFEKFLDEITTITQNPNLVIKINNRYMNWTSAGPIIIAALVYHRPLSPDVINMVIEANTPKVTKQTVQQQQQQQSQQQQQTDSSKRSGWRNSFFGWGNRKTQTQPTTQTNEPLLAKQILTTTATEKAATPPSSLLTTAKHIEGVMFDEDLVHQPQQSQQQEQEQQQQQQEQEPSLTVKTDEKSLAKEKEIVDAFKTTQHRQHRQFGHRSHHLHHHHHDHLQTRQLRLPSQNSIDSTNSEVIFDNKRYHKTTRLSSDLIEKLNLNPGINEIQYSVTTALQGLLEFYFLLKSCKT